MFRYSLIESGLGSRPLLAERFAVTGLCAVLCPPLSGRRIPAK